MKMNDLKFEKYLDMIAEGKAKWFNILDQYYKAFNPIVVKLMDESKHLKEQRPLTKKLKPEMIAHRHNFSFAFHDLRADKDKEQAADIMDNNDR